MDQRWSARDQHRATVLALLHRGHMLTRSEIAERLGLTRSTVSELLGDLLATGVITVTESRAPGGRGRPAEVLGIHPGAVRYMGFEFSHTGVTICLANSAADVVASGTSTYPSGSGWEARVTLARRLIDELTVGGVHLGLLAGIGIGLPGPNSASWDGFATSVGVTEPFQLVRARIKEFFADEFACRVIVDHHIRFAALYEATSSGEDDRSIVYLRLSTGVGGAVLNAGTAIRGAHRLAGEIGHMTVDDSPDALPCRCGRAGCLETVASKGAVSERWQRIIGDDEVLNTPESLAHLTSAVEREDPRALALVNDVAVTVGRALGLAAVLADPEEIVLAGEVAPLLTPALAALNDAVARYCLTGDELQVRIADTADEQAARGAIVALRFTDSLPEQFAPARAISLVPLTFGGLSVR